MKKYLKVIVLGLIISLFNNNLIDNNKYFISTPNSFANSNINKD